MDRLQGPTEAEPSVGHGGESRLAALAGVQETIWLHERLRPGTAAYHLALALDVRSPIDPRIAEAAIAHVTDRHDVLRTSFAERDGHPVRVVHRRVMPDVQTIDADGWSDDEVDDRVDREIEAPFDVDRAPLFRVRLLTRGPDDHVLVLVLHHLVLDVWSMSLLVHEIADTYATLAAGRTPPGDVDSAYDDFVRTQQEQLAGDRGRRSLRYWAGFVEQLRPMQLPGDERADLEARGAVCSVPVPADLSDSLFSWARTRDVSVRAVVLAAYHVVLARLADEPRTHVAEFVANRSMRELGVVGSFANTALRTAHVAATADAESFVRTVHTQLRDSRPHDRYPFGALVRECLPETSPGVLDASFSWHKVPRGTAGGVAAAFTSGRRGEVTDVAGLRVAPRPVRTRPAVTPVMLVGVAVGEHLELAIEYQRARVDAPTARRIGERVVAALRAIVGEPGARLGDIDLVLPDERRAREAEWKRTAAEPAGPDVLQRFRAHVAAVPDAIAIGFGDAHVSYAELDGRVRELTAMLRSAGVGPGERVGVCLERSPDLIAGLLAIWCCGAAYVPIEAGLPRRRVDSMLATAGIERVVGRADSWPTEEGGGETDVDLIDPDRHPAGPERSTDRASAAESDLAYVIFTSGSTGVPKGVGVEHRNLANLATAMERQLGLGAGDRVLATTTLGFDISVLELLVPLAVGAQIVLLGDEERLDLHAVARELAGVTVAQATPTMWRLLTATGWSGSDDLTILCGGEELPGDLAEQLLSRCAALWNMYGPTETTVWSTAQRLTTVTGRPPIGRPILGTRLHVLDEQRRPVPDGAVGELWIAGRGVARGYVGRPDLTAERFVADPFGGEGRMYRTGDLVRRRPSDGALVFHGRVDDQIKLHGHRIELGEIEAALAQLPGVEHAAAAVRSFGPDDVRLIGFVVADRSRPVSPSHLRDRLRRALPAAMIPATIVPTERLPLTASGKVDRNRLPFPRLPGVATEPTGTGAAPTGSRPSSGEPPRDGTEAIVADVWREVLKTAPVGRDDDFFELGGQSLLAVRMLARLERATGTRLPVASLLDAPTVAALATLLDGARSDAASWRSMVQVKRGGDGRPPFFYVSPFLITVLSMRPIAAHLAREQPFYVFQPQGLERDDPVHTDVAAMASHYIDEMRTVQPHGPYLLGGHCAGSWVAFEMTRQLQAGGEEVGLLVLVDSEPPIFEPPTTGLRPLLRQAVHYARDGRLLPAIGWKLAVARERIWRRRIGSAYERRVAEVRAEHAAAHARYRASPIEGDAVLVRSGEWNALPHYDWHLRWSELIGGSLAVDVVPGTHAGLVDPESARALATILSRRIGRHRPARPGSEPGRSPSRHDPQRHAG